MKSFDEVVDKKFLEEYGWRIEPEYGIIGEDGKIDFRKLRETFNAFDGEMYPNRFTYALIHGHLSLISSWNLPAKFRGKEEEVYGLCLRREKTWEEVLGYSKPQEGVLL